MYDRPILIIRSTMYVFMLSRTCAVKAKSRTKITNSRLNWLAYLIIILFIRIIPKKYITNIFSFLCLVSSRYSDILVHRLLAVAISAIPSFPQIFNKQNTQVNMKKPVPRSCFQAKLFLMTI